MNEGFCTHCNHQIESFEGLTCCPNCGTKGKPCSYSEQLNVSININEVRLLCIWAENWASRFTGKDAEHKEVVYAIANRIKKQLPESLAKVPLTMRDEFSDLKQSFPDFETNHPAADNPETGDNYRP